MLLKSQKFILKYIIIIIIILYWVASVNTLIYFQLIISKFKFQSIFTLKMPFINIIMSEQKKKMSTKKKLFLCPQIIYFANRRTNIWEKKLRHQFFLHADILQNKAKLIYFACRLHTHVFVAQKLNLFMLLEELVHHHLYNKNVKRHIKCNTFTEYISVDYIKCGLPLVDMYFTQDVFFIHGSKKKIELMIR